METSFFLASNSGKGFYSLYDSFPGEGSFLHIIKGGPGTGKSSFMRRIAKAASERGLDIELILCSGDPDSLDGLYIPDLKQAWVDGTAPHVQEPKVFGVDSDYVNLGRFFRGPLDKGSAKGASELTHDYRSLYASAYSFLAAEAAVAGAFEAEPLDREELEHMEEIICDILDGERRRCKKGTGRQSKRFISAISCKGKVQLEDSVEKLCKQNYRFDVRRGLIKSLVSFIGLVAIVIISYTLRVPLAEFLIDTLPFFNFGGALEGLTALNILIYNILSFVFIFILLYCILNIIIALTGFIDTLLKFTVIWIIPSKIGGAIVGFLESWIFLFLAVFVFAQFSFSAGIIRDSHMAGIILNNTPVIGHYLGGASKAAEEIYEEIETYAKDDEKTTEDLNLKILQIEINYGLVSSEKATELMEIGKVGLKNVVISTPTRG